MSNGRASSETEASRVASRARMARRVGSASAANVTLSAVSGYLTIWLTIGQGRDVSRRPAPAAAGSARDIPFPARGPILTPVIYTIGHSTRAFGEFLNLLHAHGVTQVTDVRRYAASRRHPQFAEEALGATLAAAGIAYRHEADLGGRRPARRNSPNTAWRSPAFRGYADYMETTPFQAALARLVDEARTRPTAILCAEAVPWRCHRQLIADALVARGETVGHILDEARLEPHRLSAHAQIRDGIPHYPAGPPDQIAWC